MIVEWLRLMLMRALVIVGAPMAFFLMWLTGPPNWREEWRVTMRHIWRAKRGPDFHDWTKRQTTNDEGTAARDTGTTKH
jgi:hypothetical protein